MAKATTRIGMTVQLLDKNTGNAVRRKWFGFLDSAKEWLDWQYPDWQNKYDVEIFYDEA